MAQHVMNLTRILEDVGSIPSPLSGLRIRHWHKLWRRSQMQPGSGVSVAAV